jgi:hypothetical protein
MDAAVGTRTTLPQRIKLALVAATLMLSLGIGLTANTQQVDARPSEHCMIIEGEDMWYALTGYRADADWVGGMLCWKG